MRTVYLCGPIANCDNVEANGWRSRFCLGIVGHPFRALDPMRRDYRDTGLSAEEVKLLVEQDKHDIAACDYVLANPWKPSAGTHMEILFAWSIHKPVITIAPARDYVSPWVLYHTTHRVESIIDALALLVQLAQD